MSSIGRQILDHIPSLIDDDPNATEPQSINFRPDADQVITAMVEKHFTDTADIEQRMERGIERILIDVIENGREIMSPKGDMQRVQANEQFIRAAMTWLQAKRKQRDDGSTDNPFEDVYRQIQEAHASGSDLPPVSMEDDPATA